MDFTQLKYFKTLAELEHMTAAATALHIAQPALSRSLRTLEEELGVRLFDRVGKNIVLNASGRVVLRNALVILGARDSIRLELDDLNRSSEQSVGVMMYAGSKLLPELISGFKQKYPDIRLDIMQQNLDAAVSSPADITVFSSMFPASGADETTLMEEELYLALPSEDPLSGSSGIDLAAVSERPFICLHKGKGLRLITDEFCRMAGFVPNIIVESDSPGIVRDLIALGVGLAFVPEVSWRGIDRSPSVKLVKIVKPHCKRYVNMKIDEGRYQTDAAAKLKEYLIEFFAQASDNGGSGGRGKEMEI